MLDHLSRRPSISADNNFSRIKIGADAFCETGEQCRLQGIPNDTSNARNTDLESSNRLHRSLIPALAILMRVCAQSASDSARLASLDSAMMRIMDSVLESRT